jgi:hypothetical protein
VDNANAMPNVAARRSSCNYLLCTEESAAGAWGHAEGIESWAPMGCQLPTDWQPD